MIGKNTDKLIDSAKINGKANQVQSKNGYLLSRRARKKGNQVEVVTNTVFCLGAVQGCTSSIELY